MLRTVDLSGELEGAWSGQVAEGNRKDIREAVEAAHKAAPGSVLGREREGGGEEREGGRGEGVWIGTVTSMCCHGNSQSSCLYKVRDCGVVGSI